MKESKVLKKMMSACDVEALKKCLEENKEDTRNIQKKPVVKRDPMSSEMLKMRQQLEFLQAELFARGGCSSNEVQVLKERIAWLEAANEDICHELHDYRSRYTAVE